MAFISTVPLDQATGEVRAIYQRNQGRLGYVANYTKAFDELEVGLRRRFEVGRGIDPKAPERLGLDGTPDA